jgi:2-polyprenyl-3-methyl-5-hydroxy-6-metoxy-1,4-benzoquinol methylase
MKGSQFSEEDVARYWDQNADLWAEQVRKGWDYYREHFNSPAFLRFTGDLRGKTVLDAGCGEGYSTRLLARSGARMTGVDISQKMIDLARQEEEREPLGIRYEVASFSDLSIFGDASFDTVVSFMALMDGPDLGGASREILRVLRPGGELIFSITHPCFMTRGYGWMEDENGNATKLTVSNYFGHQPYVEHWRFEGGPAPKDAEPFAVPVFPRTLSEYVNTLIRAGFVLEEIAEPRPSEDMCEKHPWLQRWRDHATLFLYVRAVKPAGRITSEGRA